MRKEREVLGTRGHKGKEKEARQVTAEQEAAMWKGNFVSFEQLDL